jgi:hypothetical protein
MSSFGPKRRVFLTVFVLVLLSMIVGRGYAPYSVVVSVDPHQKLVKLGQVFTVDVKVENVTGLQGVDFCLKYNSVILNAMNVEEGDFMKSFGPTFVVKQDIDKEYQLYRGRVWFVIVIYGNGSATGSGTLATITFNATAAGEGDLDLFSISPYQTDTVKLVTCGPIPIPNSVSDGHVVVSNDPADPPGDPPKDPVDDPPASPSPDLNGDGRIDITDIAIVGRAYGKSSIDPDYNSKADIDGNGVVDIRDITIVAVEFGRLL